MPKLRLYEYTNITTAQNSVPIRVQVDDATIEWDLTTVNTSQAMVVSKRADQGDNWATLTTPFATQTGTGTLTGAITGLKGGEVRVTLTPGAVANQSGVVYLVY